jgi:hypothetical protein
MENLSAKGALALSVAGCIRTGGRGIQGACQILQITILTGLLVLSYMTFISLKKKKKEAEFGLA